MFASSLEVWLSDHTCKWQTAQATKIKGEANCIRLKHAKGLTLQALHVQNSDCLQDQSLTWGSETFLVLSVLFLMLEELACHLA